MVSPTGSESPASSSGMSFGLALPCPTRQLKRNTQELRKWRPWDEEDTGSLVPLFLCAADSRICQRLLAVSESLRAAGELASLWSGGAFDSRTESPVAQRLAGCFHPGGGVCGCGRRLDVEHPL